MSPKIEEELLKIKIKYIKQNKKINKVDIVFKILEDYFILKEKYELARITINELKKNNKTVEREDENI